LWSWPDDARPSYRYTRSKAASLVWPKRLDDRVLVLSIAFILVSLASLTHYSVPGLPISSGTKVADWQMPEFQLNIDRPALTQSSISWPDNSDLSTLSNANSTAQAASGVQDLLLNLSQAPAPLTPSYFTEPKPVSIFVEKEGINVPLVATRSTVGAALAAEQIKVSPYDLVVPGVDKALEPGMTIYVYPSKQIHLFDGAISGRVHTHAMIVEQALEKADITLGELDRVEPSLTTPVTDGMSITVTRVHQATELVQERIAHDVVYRNDPTIPYGQTATIQEGSDGVHQIETFVTYENGREIERKTVNSWIDPEPRPTIIARGTGGAAGAYQPAAPVYRAAQPAVTGPSGGYSMTVYATWYNASHGGRSRSDPNYGRTATGAYATHGVVAVDPSVIPLGTRMYIPGYGYAVAADIGGGVRGNHIDLAFPEGIATPWSSGNVTIQILP
jgi:3D (Asp-Asp-Asp) domain-containing protein